MTMALPALKLATGLASTLRAASAPSPSAASPASAAAAARDAKLRGTAQDFEAVFLEDQVGRLFDQLGKEGPLGAGGAGGDIWRSMLSKEYAKGIAKAGGVGLAEPVYRELVRLQEARAGGARG